MRATSDANQPGAEVRLSGVRRVFPGNVEAISSLSLTVSAGEFLAILGPSGCGKSTLLRITAGLDRPTEGEVIVSEAASMAYVFQDAHLLPWRNVLRNVELPLELLKISKLERREQAMAVLEQVGLADAVRQYPGQLSGGMRMRVSLARALVCDPSLLLLDEPFAALDEITRQRLDEQLRELWAKRKMTVIFVTHSTAEAVFLAERAVVMSPRPGRIILDVKIELPVDRSAEMRGASEFAAQTRELFAALEKGGRA